jgi:hypothetical protein
VVIPDGCMLGVPDVSRVALRFDGLELIDGSILGVIVGCWEGTILAVGFADAFNIGLGDSVGF